MAKYTILFGCGHIDKIEASGTEQEQKGYISYMKICGLCPECERKKKEQEQK